MLRRLFISLLSFLYGPGEALAQCAMCNAATDAGAAGRAFSLSVLFLLGALASVVGWLVYLAVRSASRADPPADPESGGGAARSS